MNLKNLLNQAITKDVGKNNGATRERWLEKTLLSLKEGTSILDAGAGESKYKSLCNHLEYFSQDIAEYDGELAVIDFKTAAKPKPKEWIENYFVQAAAYACMFYELTDILVKKFVILMSCENGEVVEYVIRGEEKTEYIKLLARYVQNFVEHKLNQYGTGT